MYYRARHYAPQTGKFLQRDPVGYETGPNLFGYVGCKVTSLRDPSGMEEEREHEWPKVSTLPNGTKVFRLPPPALPAYERYVGELQYPRRNDFYPKAEFGDEGASAGAAESWALGALAEHDSAVALAAQAHEAWIEALQSAKDALEALIAALLNQWFIEMHSGRGGSCGVARDRSDLGAHLESLRSQLAALSAALGNAGNSSYAGQGHDQAIAALLGGYSASLGRSYDNMDKAGEFLKAMLATWADGLGIGAGGPWASQAGRAFNTLVPAVSEHAALRMSQRGIGYMAVLKARWFPLATKVGGEHPALGPSTVFIGRGATIVTSNRTGTVISVWKTGAAVARRYAGR